MSKELKALHNVGPATLKYLKLLGINSVEELAKQDAGKLYRRLQVAQRKYKDPCTWDLFHAIIHEAKTGKATDWWEWTDKRKKLQPAGKIKKFEKK